MKSLFMLAAFFAVPNIATAQTAARKADKPAASQKAGSGPESSDKAAQSRKKAKADIDSFFKDAEAQARKAQEHSGPGCVPRPEPKESKPVS